MSGFAPNEAPKGSPAGARVVVLGGTGLIGSATVRALLDAGHDVVAVARTAADAAHAELLAGATVVAGDCRDRAVLRDVLGGSTHVVDALGAPHPADSARAPLKQFDAEVPVLLGILDEVAALPDARFTYLSSGGAIYGNVDVLPIPEDTECHPVSPYGVTKLAAERYVLMASHTQGLDVQILRVANAYGALQRPRTGQGIVAALFQAVATRTPIELFGDGSTVRDFVDVRDVAAAVVALGSLEGGPSVVNVGSGTGHDLRAVHALAESVCGTEIAIDRSPARTSDVSAVVLDVARLASLTSWSPRPLEEGMRDAWDHWVRWGLDRSGIAADAP